MRKLTLIAVMALIAGSSAFAQDFSFSAQFRERTEFDAKTITTGQSMDVFHLLRTRFSANAAINEDVTVFIEIQDARAMGQESSTMNMGASHFDLRQGFVKVSSLGGSMFDAKLGRQVLSYANERLIGAIDWSNFGQSFDGGVLSAQFKHFKLDLIAAAVDRNSANPYVRDEFLTGLWGVWSPTADQNSVQPFFLYDNPVESGNRVRRFTAGVYTNWLFDNLDVAFDGAYQFGEFPNTTISATNEDPVGIAAYMAGLRVGYTIEQASNLRIGVGVDMLSGNAAPDEGQDEETIESFSTLYATNHKFYGHMDYFTSFTTGSGHLGLMDIIVQLSLAPRESWKAGLDFHMLSTAVDPKDFLPANTTSEVETSLGMELDVWTSFSVAKAVWATLGLSVMDWADRDKMPMGSYYMKTTKWGWVQVMVNI